MTLSTVAPAQLDKSSLLQPTVRAVNAARMIATLLWSALHIQRPFYNRNAKSKHSTIRAMCIHGQKPKINATKTNSCGYKKKIAISLTLRNALLRTYRYIYKFLKSFMKKLAAACSSPCTLPGWVSTLFILVPAPSGLFCQLHCVVHSALFSLVMPYRDD